MKRRRQCSRGLVVPSQGHFLVARSGFPNGPDCALTHDERTSDPANDASSPRHVRCCTSDTRGAPVTGSNRSIR